MYILQKCLFTPKMDRAYSPGEMAVMKISAFGMDASDIVSEYSP